MVMQDLSYLHYPSFTTKSHLFYYKRFIPRCLQKAAGVAAVSASVKDEMTNQYKISPDKITVTYKGIDESFKPLNEEDKEAVRNEHTDGQQYFIYTGAVHARKNLVNLLKAFSIFKKRQKTNWKLVLASTMSWPNQGLIESLKTYKYRQEIVLKDRLEKKELAKLVASAYAFVSPSLWEGFATPIIEAMACNIPVIISDIPAMKEITMGDALYIDPNNHQDIADKMMIIYKDENLRGRLIHKAETIAKAYSWERTADLLWTDILKVTAGRL